MRKDPFECKGDKNPYKAWGEYQKKDIHKLTADFVQMRKIIFIILIICCFFIIYSWSKL